MDRRALGCESVTQINMTSGGEKPSPFYVVDNNNKVEFYTSIERGKKLRKGPGPSPSVAMWKCELAETRHE